MYDCIFSFELLKCKTAICLGEGGLSYLEAGLCGSFLTLPERGLKMHIFITMALGSLTPPPKKKKKKKYRNDSSAYIFIKLREVNPIK